MGGKATVVVDEVTLRKKERAKELEPIGKKKKEPKSQKARANSRGKKGLGWARERRKSLEEKVGFGGP